MINNPIQFAVVREDPDLPILALKTLCQTPSSALIIASGGCTALSIASQMPNLHLTLLDKNPAQLDLVKLKFDKIPCQSRDELKSHFNIGTASKIGLNECGNFESLFRNLRNFLYDMVITYGQLKDIFETKNLDPEEKSRVFSNKYWKVAFEIFFSDALLNAMFGPDATQNADAGSYPLYFQRCLERGLNRSDAGRNYFLHHILLGHYLDDPLKLPLYLQNPPKSLKVSFLLGGIEDAVDRIDQYDFIDVSNIFDWMNHNDVKNIASLLDSKMKSGSVLMFRQLNNTRALQAMFPNISFDNSLGLKMLDHDRSLFYCKINVGRKR